MAISMNFTKLAVTHSILVQKLCSWARFECQKCEYRYPLIPIPVTHEGYSTRIVPCTLYSY